MTPLETIADPSSPLRRLVPAVEALGRERARAAVPRLIELLRRDDGYLQVTVAEALAKIGDVRALEPLEVTPAEDVSQQLYGSVSRTFGAVASALRAQLPPRERRRDAARLLRLAGSDDASVARRAQAALRELPDEVRPALVALSRDGDERERLRAVRGLGDLEPRPVAALAAALDDPHPPVRAEAALGLRYHGAAAVPALIARLDDPEPRVRLQAVLALETLRAEEAIPQLERVAAHDAGQVDSGPRHVTRVADAAASCLRSLRRALG